MVDFTYPIDNGCQVACQFYKRLADHFQNAGGIVQLRPTEVGLTDQFILAVSEESKKTISIVSTWQVLRFRVLLKKSHHFFFFTQTRTTPAIESVEGHDFTLQFSDNGKTYLVLLQGTLASEVSISDTQRSISAAKVVIAEDDGYARPDYKKKLVVSCAHYVTGIELTARA
jgi:hypothetical protein